jgi:hypothetical protein
VRSTTGPRMLPDGCASEDDPRAEAAVDGAADGSPVAAAATGGSCDWARVGKPQSRAVKPSHANLALYRDIVTVIPPIMMLSPGV